MSFHGDLHRKAYEAWQALGEEPLNDCELRAAAQYARAIGDHEAERRIDAETAQSDAR